MLNASRNNGEAKEESNGPAAPVERNAAEPTNNAIEVEASPITNFAMSAYIESSGIKVPFSPLMSIANGPGASFAQINLHNAGNIKRPTTIPAKPGN
jgi:hypothetical protein